MFRAIGGLRRWRRSALCRPSDLAEAWIALGALLLIVCGAPLAGALAGQTAHRTLQATVRAQQEQRHQVWATVERVLPHPASGADQVDDLQGRQRVVAAWTAPGGAERRAALTVVRKLAAGERFRLWTDHRGALVAPPMDASSARSHAALAGLVVAVLTAVLVELARRVAVRMLLRRRYAEWEREWARVGPDWGRSWPAASN